ncbi:uncharacterized protein LOC103722211 isoform X2 [Phoenix dactylifera]|uniref:Uncharacterized protein LOC103722211 isoform X2 n=1 Tax=Phoenix dactylifera TaxID=42345 RepID=A0A8B9B0A5_PHODC|nr:uncharacterized protein LOC103722211 isoform X2 [Phoenix dactylifera]
MDRWEDEIDVDDSDLPSLLPQPRPFPSSSSSNPSLTPSIPSLRPCSQLSRPSQTLATNPPPPPPRLQFPPLVAEGQEDEAPPRSKTHALRLIPGPAGAVQAAMHRKSATTAAAAVREHGSSSCWEDQDGDGWMLDMDEEDGDFKLNPWLCAMEFLGAGCSLVSPISSIETWTAERVPQVVGIIKSCTPNGLGDLFLTLKDPTGTIGASVHRKVLTESNLGGDISVGCVLILEQVAAFCPARAMRYLNVTMNNVMKLINKDCGPPHKQMVPSITARLHPSDQASAELSWRHRIESSADEEVRRDLNCEKILNSRKTGTSENLPCSTSAIAATTNVSTRPGFCLGTSMEIGLGTAAGKPSLRERAENTAAEEARGNLNCGMMMDSRMTGLARNMPCGTSAAATTAIIPAKPDPKTNGSKNLISRVSVAEWTDEQLLELFADYQDDV